MPKNWTVWSRWANDGRSRPGQVSVPGWVAGIRPLLPLAAAVAMLLPLMAIWRAPAAVAAGTTVTLGTVASATITVGGAVTDTATLSGGSGPNGPTGTISFSIFGPGDTACASAVATSATPVAGDGSYASAPFTPVEPGTYQWVATYNGDANNAGASEPCATGGESVFVRQAAPTMTTQASGSSGAGYAITDNATLSGGTRPTGLIVFSVFGPGDTTCVSPLATSTATVSGDGPYSSALYDTSTPGTYQWVASYQGDVDNLATGDGCGAAGESVVVPKASPWWIPKRQPRLSRAAVSPTPPTFSAPFSYPVR
jgi:hypothetical protein